MGCPHSPFGLTLMRFATPANAEPLCDAIRWVDLPLSVHRGSNGRIVCIARDDSTTLDPDLGPEIAVVPACRPHDLGDTQFRDTHGVRFALASGAMANGIASEPLVEAMARAGLLGIFGAAGLPPRRVEQAIDRLQTQLGSESPFGFNLIHSPNEPNLEASVVDLYLKRQIRLVEASAYLRLTPHVVRYRVHGIHRDGQGQIIVPNRIIAKVSREEVARQFLSPPPRPILNDLVSRGSITASQAEMADQIPMAEDLTAEADSGGHTDNRAALTLLPLMITLRDRHQERYGTSVRLRVGAAGGIATPGSAAAALAMGADYLVTGSINQACIEAGTSDHVRRMLAEAQQADVTMAPAADMFEMGVKLQVLKRGTMFAMRAAKLFEIYQRVDSLEAIPESERLDLESKIFRAPLERIWAQTIDFFRERDPSQIDRAEADPKHKLALIFRWYLGLSSHWANAGQADRAIDYQVWCGPAMGAFNSWVRGSHLEDPANRRVAEVALNILYGAAVLTRVQVLRSQGIDVPAEARRVPPLPRDQLTDVLGSSTRPWLPPSQVVDGTDGNQDASPARSPTLPESANGRTRP